MLPELSQSLAVLALRPKGGPAHTVSPTPGPYQSKYSEEYGVRVCSYTGERASWPGGFVRAHSRQIQGICEKPACILTTTLHRHEEMKA